MKLKKSLVVFLVLGLLSGCALGHESATTVSAPMLSKDSVSTYSSGRTSTQESSVSKTAMPSATSAPTALSNSGPVGSTASVPTAMNPTTQTGGTATSVDATGATPTNDIITTQTATVVPSSTPTPNIQNNVEKLILTQDNFFKNYGVNPFVNTLTDHFSTFAVDVDTASYTWMRKSLLESNSLPVKDSVRTEEYVNYFNYNYPQPTEGKFSINTDVSEAVFGEKNSGTKIIRIGLQGKTVEATNRKQAILTFVIDISGSMDMENRLGLVKKSLESLLDELDPNDKVGIVVFGSQARVLLDHKTVSSKDEIIKAINSLQTEGATNAEGGLKLGYQLANKAMVGGAINRVILCSDGVANVGQTDQDSILNTIKQASEGGINLSTIGFGMGNYNDVLMEQLADKGDGNYYYVDTLSEAQRVFKENLTGVLQVIAKDAKVQVDFNADVVKEYRLLGYENRDIADQDFRNDKVDAGEIGSGHSVTALYEVILKNNDATTGKIADVYLRYKDVDNYNSVIELNKAINMADMTGGFKSASPSFKLAVAVSKFAEILKGSYWAKDNNLETVLSLAMDAQDGLPKDEKINEFISLVQKAISLKANLTTVTVRSNCSPVFCE